MHEGDEGIVEWKEVLDSEEVVVGLADVDHPERRWIDRLTTRNKK